MRKIELSYQKNARDLGGLTGFNGKKVKYNLIFRGGLLSRVSPKDIEIINNLHLTDIVDFRGPDEFKNKPDYPFEGVTFHNFSPFIEKTKAEEQKYEDGNLLYFIGNELKGYEHMLNTYPTILTSEMGIKAYKDFFSLLLKENNVIYFHCSQGKDRAGLAAYLFEVALGVNEKEIIEDYLLSNVAMESKKKQLKFMLKNKNFYSKEYEHALDDVFSAKIEYLNNAINELKIRYGSVMNYITEILKVDIDKLREKYLEE